MPTSLAPLTTLRLGGPARELVVATSEADLVEAARTEGLLLGGGSNVVLPDAGLDRVVLVRSMGIDGMVVQAGEDWDDTVQVLLSQGYAGLEPLSGIPGTVGAAPIQNIGAYGAEVATLLAGVRVLDRGAGVVADLSAAECGFSYRTSRFKAEPDRWCVLSVTFALERGGLSAPVGYAELARVLGITVGERAPVQDVRDAVLELRRGKGMVLDEDDPDSVSAGSFFTNPLVDAAPDGAPSWADPSGQVKVSAAWLIEQAGFSKGWGEGPVGLSTKHALALVHRGGGTTADLVQAARAIRDGVRDRFGITLVNEPVLVDDAL